ncbi:MAG: glycosyltransferase [Bacteroidales bacterium]
MKGPLMSVIIAFYNRLDALSMLLASLDLQKFRDFEVIIADDGSSDRVVGELDQIISKSKLDIRHIWHEDRGWRKNIILNKAVLACRSDYLVFIDGDCILHPLCLLEHFHHREPGWAIAGRRVNLSKAITESLNVEKVKRGDLWGRLWIRILLEGMIKKTGHPENAIYFKSSFIRKRINQKDKGIMGSHHSLYKKDLILVNGFDERYTTPAAGEDTDLEFRIRRNGVRIKTLKHIAIQYHLYHKPLIRDKRSLELLGENMKSGLIRTPFGIRKEFTGSTSR